MMHLVSYVKFVGTSCRYEGVRFYFTWYWLIPKLLADMVTALYYPGTQLHCPEAQTYCVVIKSCHELVVIVLN